MEHPENSAKYKGLTVNAGVDNLPSVNPYATFRRRKQVLSAEEYVEGILRGDMRLLNKSLNAAYPMLAMPYDWVSQVCQELVNPPSLRHSVPCYASRANTLRYWLSTLRPNAAKVVSLATKPV